MIEQPPPNVALPQPSPEQQRFARLIRSVEREWVTYGLLAVNIAVLAAMVANGVSATAPTPEQAIQWGASTGLLTRNGDFWRLYSANYVHYGVVHLGFNMYVLFRAGPLAERIFGHVGYLVAYAFAGFAGSIVSVFWNDPFVASAGASGAIFGIFGMVGAFLVRRRHAMPPEVVKALRNQVVTFVVLNVTLAFMIEGLDQAAHMGGLAGGFGAGLLLTPELTDEGPRRPYKLYPIPIALMIAITIAFAAGAFAYA